MGGFDGERLTPEELARPPEARDDLINDQRDIVRR